MPVDIFWDDPDRSATDASAMQEWCKAATGGEDDGTSRFHRLWDSLGTLKERLVWTPRLPYCSLVSSTTASTAIEIFVGVNENALTLKTIQSPDRPTSRQNTMSTSKIGVADCSPNARKCGTIFR